MPKLKKAKVKQKRKLAKKKSLVLLARRKKITSRSVKRARKQEVIGEVIFDSNKGSTDALFVENPNNQKTPPEAMSFGAEAGGVGPHSMLNRTMRLSDADQIRLVSTSDDLRNSIIPQNIPQNKKTTPPKFEDAVFGPILKNVTPSDKQVNYSKPENLVKGDGKNRDRVSIFAIAENFIKKFFPKNVFSSMLMGLVFAGLFSTVFYVFALPYTPGETTNPTCSPGATDCTVTASVPYTGATAAVDLGARTLTTTGAGSLGSLTLTTSALTVGNGGTGLSAIAVGSILGANTLSTLTAITSTTGTKVLTNTSGTISWETQAGMTYPGAGIALSTGTAWGTSITDNSANWNTAYTDRLKWDGGATGLVAATGRTSLGLVIGTDVQAYNANLASLAGLTYASTSFVKMTAAGTFALDTATYLTSLSGALLDTGATIGATSQAQVFTNGVITGKIYPSADSITAVQIKKADGATSILNVDTTNGFVGIGTITPTARLQIGGNLSTASWTTTGIAFSSKATTYTDTSTAASGTVAVRTANSFGAPTFASTNAITVTDAFTLYVLKPVAGPNTTITRANSAYFEGEVGIGTTSPGALLDIGLAGTTLGVIRLEGSTSGYAAIQPTAAAGNITITLPDATGTAALGTGSANQVAYWSGTNTLAGEAYLALTRGGTNASLTASNGGIFYSTATAGAILAGTATANQLLLSGLSTTPAWSTTTYPSTNAVSTLLYASSANVMSALATANSGVLVTSGTGVPSIATDIPTAVTIGTAYIYRAGGTDVPLLDGGTNASLTASNGGIFYSTATAGAILAGTATANQILMSGASTTPAWSTATYPATTTVNQVLYSTSANVVGAGAGLTFDGTTLTVTATGGAQEKLAYDGSNYTNITAGSTGNLTVSTATGTTGGDIIIQPTGSGDPNILSDTGKLVLGGNSNTNNENLKLDFETTANTVLISSSTGTATLSFDGDTAWAVKEGRNTTTNGSNFTLTAGGGLSGGTNLTGGNLYLSSGISTGSGSSDMFFQTATAGASGTADVTPTTKFTVRGNNSVVVGTGTALATTATAGFLYIPTSAGAQTGTPVADTTGTSPIAYDTTNNRLYIYNPTGTPAWKYIAITGGFQIPDYETADPISGEKIEEGDIVLGRIDKTMEDSALHATWVTWNSVKKQLLAEARGELSKTTGAWGSGTVEGVETETFLDKVKNILFSLGISVKDGLVSIANLAVEKFSAETADISKLQMKDEDTGEIYCVSIKSGELVRAKGECSSVVATTTASQVPAMSDIAITAMQPETSDVSPAGATSDVNAASAAQQIVQQAQETANQAQQAANNALQTTEQARQAVQEQVQQVVEQAAESADKAAKDAVKEMKEEIKEEVKQELQAEKSQAPMSNTQPNSNDENLNNENAAGEQPASEQPAQEEQPVSEDDDKKDEEDKKEKKDVSIGELIKNATAGLLNAIWDFINRIFNLGFEKISSLPFIKNATASILNIFQDTKLSILQNSEELKSGLPSTRIQTFSANLFVPIDNLLNRLFGK